MRKQDHLNDLIANLTQGERKFFKQNYQSQGAGQSYMKLYKLLSQKRSYDTDELCLQLGKSKAGLANEKKYLNKQLLAALREYHAADPQVAVLHRLAESVVLINKKLPLQAATAVKAGIDAASDLDIPALSLHAHGLMLTLTCEPFSSFSDTEEIAAYHLAQMKELAAEVQHMIDLELLNTEAFSAYTKRKMDLTEKHRRETRKLLADPLLQNEFRNVKLESSRLNLLGILFARLGDPGHAISVNQKYIALLESQKTIEVWGYWNALSNMTQSLILKGDAKAYQTWIDKLDSAYYRRLPVDAQQLQILVTNYRSIYTSGAYYKLLQKGALPIEQARLFTKNFIKSFAREQEIITPSLFISTVYRVAACAFMIGDLDDCIDLLNRLFNELDTAAYSSVHRLARMLFIMAHTEWHRYVLLPGIHQSTVSYLKKSGQYGKVEERILHAMLHLAKPMKTKERKAWFMDFKTLLEKLHRLPDLRTGIDILPYTAWIDRGLKQ